jgi:hypothetical protein
MSKFKPGVSGNPAAKPRGTRNKLTADFFADLFTVWSERGIGALRVMAVEHPEQFCKLTGALMPKELQVAVGTVEAA